MRHTTPILGRPLGRGSIFVEALIIVIVFGTLAALVVPQFSSAAGESRDFELRDHLFQIRSQIKIYNQQHGGRMPTSAHISQQLTMPTNANGDTVKSRRSGFELGPYLIEIPMNPHTGTNTISDGPLGSSAWFYNENTGEFRANDTVCASAPRYAGCG